MRSLWNGALGLVNAPDRLRKTMKAAREELSPNSASKVEVGFQPTRKHLTPPTRRVSSLSLLRQATFDHTDNCRVGVMETQ